MTKKSVMQLFKDFVDASPAQSNEPMTSREIAAARATNKPRRAAAKRATKTAAKKASKKAKKAAPKRSATKSRKAKKKSKR